MFQYEDLMWLISFPLVCAIMLWFSLDLAVLVRVGGGRRRRANARRAIERLILNSPVCAAAGPVVQSPTSPLHATYERHARPELAAGGSSSSVEEKDDQPHERLSYNSHYQHHHRRNASSSARSSTASSLNRASFAQPQLAFQKVRQVVVPTALRIATRAVVRRAVVLVGGDFARSPRMQYHAASLARSGLVDEVLLVGLDFGNQLSEDLLISGEPQPENFVTREGNLKGLVQGVYDVEARLASPDVHAGHGCVVSTRYLASPPSPPDWFQAAFPLRSLHWVVCTIYRVVVLTALFAVQTMRGTATRINEHGQLLVTDLVLIQSPPAVPFIPLVKFVVCPLAFVYNVLLYYCVIVPAAWMSPDAMRDVRNQCQLQSHRFLAPHNTVEAAAAAATTASLDSGENSHGHSLYSLPGCRGSNANSSLSRHTATAPATAGVDMVASSTSACSDSSVALGVMKWCSRARPWVFYPAVVVDWHNYGYTILEQSQRPTALVQLYKFFELHLCAGNVNVTVSQAMRQSLEHFYSWLRPRPSAASTMAIDAMLHGSVKKATLAVAPAPSALPSTNTVTVLYDVAPAFFRPASRRRCVHEVLDRFLRRRAPSPTAPNLDKAKRSPNTNISNLSSSSPYVLAPMSELEGMGWGISGPPAWVYAEVAADVMATSLLGSPVTPATTASALGLSAAAALPSMHPPRKGVMLVGSTSWTEDDDYSILLRALRRLDHRLNHEVVNHTTYRGSGNSNGNNTGNNNGSNGSAAAPASLPTATPLDLWVLITGKGPTRKRFEDAVRAAKLSSRVVVSTYYAQSYQEYSVLLGAADVGFCLHFSSSGLDLPMKGVDMVGAGLPVVALYYPAIEELMGGVTRVLAQTRVVGRAAPAANGPPQSHRQEPPALVECERGWLFQSDVDLEALLSSFVGLPMEESAASLWKAATGGMPNNAGGAAAAGGSFSRGAYATTSATTTLAPTPLPVMRRKAQEARRHALTWSDNWTKVLLPVLKQVV